MKKRICLYFKKIFYQKCYHIHFTFVDPKQGFMHYEDIVPVWQFGRYWNMTPLPEQKMIEKKEVWIKKRFDEIINPRTVDPLVFVAFMLCVFLGAVIGILLIVEKYN